ncbi:sulfatase-like hydrolase/transferase [Erythrobacter sp. BLCC-B19]|uniref:sulfatase-like hydrolase/transferase n=1 Tax=Erythrobacter sp. BLCC-B19 TaxID=3025315 RepID=UPI0023619C93|nr:sulfatase-like hydrolase/transferase [Erythrobacter sp. BLCC-B19]WDA41277.1 sulfatase-like hydrolase/transferase [Erythrobacter sp. BLCC-B19]
MKRWQTAGLGTLAVLALAAGGAYAFRTDLTLALVRWQSAQDIAPNRPVPWQQGPQAAAQSPAERPPNIIVILFDDLGMNDLSTFGGGVADGRIKTPNIDKLAAEGAIFTQAYAGNATCSPSRAQLMTGRYATRTGFEFTPTPGGFPRIVPMVWNDIHPDRPPILTHSAAEAAAPPFEEQGLPPEEVTVAEVLRTRGYHTVHIGKWHLGNAPKFLPNAQGFDESLNMDGMLHLPEDHPDVVNAHVDFDPIDRFLWASAHSVTSYNGGEKFAPGGYLADYWTDESLKVIEANRNRPFFLYLAHWGVHSPLQATRADYEAVGDLGSERLRVYAAMIRALDRSVGRIMAKLEAEGLADNTLVMISSDNGAPGYVGLQGLNAPYRGGKGTFFEGGIRVPLFARWPAQVAAGSRIALPVGQVDVMPTLAAAAGAPLPQGVAIDGRNLVPALTGKGAALRPDAPLFWSSGYYKAVRAGDWKLQINGKQGKAWLYNLAADPTEQRNLAASQPAKRAELEALIKAHEAGRRAPLYASTFDTPVSIDRTLAEPYRAGDEYIYWPN